MDLLRQLGELAIGSRMRRIIDRFSQDVEAIYAYHNLDFKPRWFGMFYLLANNGAHSVGDIAKALNISHPAINQISQEMIKADLVASVSDCRDKRKKMLTLTPQGEAMVADLRPMWEDMAAIMRQFVCATQFDLLAVFDRMDATLDQQSLMDRYMERIRRRNQECVEVIPYKPELKCHFKRLNAQWIEEYFQLEDQDHQFLNDPQTHILDQGGEILFAMVGNEVVGTTALLTLPKKPDTLELARFAVDPAHRGKHIGTKLLSKAIELAKQKGAKTLYLETSHVLLPAINLYRKSGFMMVSPDPDALTPLDRADTWMQLDLTATPPKPITPVAPSLATPL